MKSLHAFDVVGAVARESPALASAIELQSRGHWEAARRAFLALMDQPRLIMPCLNQLGLIALNRHEPARAAELFRATIALAPQEPVGYWNLSTALDQSGRGAEAIATQVSLACLLDLTHGRLDLAIEVYEGILRRDPCNYAAQANLGTVMARSGQVLHAIDHLLSALLLFGRLFPRVLSYGERLMARLDGLLPPAAVARALPPGRPNGAIERIEYVFTSLGKALGELCRPEESELCQRWAVSLAPGYALAHWNLALVLLARGEFDEGWREYEWRWHWPEFPEPRRLLPVADWRGESLEGKRIVVLAEQGLGDVMQFIPLAQRLTRQAASVVVEVPQPLVRLIANAFPEFQVTARPDSPLGPLAVNAAPDYAVPMMSLPCLLGLQADDLPLATDYLTPLPGAETVWRARIPAGGAFNVGVVWAGRPAYQEDSKRSLPFSLLQILFEIPGTRWYSLQVGAGRDVQAMGAVPQLLDVGVLLGDFADTAAAVACLDLVITVDTSTAHLAGAMGKPVWLLLPRVPDWRWGNARVAAAWYPQLRMFRQQTPGDWQPVLQQVAHALAAAATPVQ